MLYTNPLFWIFCAIMLTICFIADKKITKTYKKRLHKKWEAEKAAEEAARAEQQPQEPRHYMSQAEYDQYKREHGIK